MADPNMAETLKEFASKVTTSRLNDRRKIMGDLLPCIEKPELPEPAVKGIVKHLLYTLGRYQDGKSRHAVDKVVEALAKHHTEKTTKAFLALLTDLAEQQKKVTPCALSSGIALSAFGWCCHLIRVGFKTEAEMTGDVFNRLVSLQCLLLYGALAAQKTTISQGAYRKLRRIWKQVPGSVSRYAEALKSLEQNMYMVTMASYMMRHLAATKDHDTLNKVKGPFLQMYVKQVVATRTRPSVHLLVNCKDLLRHVSHEEFKEILMPAIDRSMLRNPEIILEGYAYLLGSLSIDLSPYALDLGKALAQHLHSKEGWMCEVAAQGTQNLAKQCSDPGAVEKLAKHYFGVLNGSEGKLTVTEQRLWMLTGVGRLSQHTVSGAATLNGLSSEVAELFITFLGQEVHEGTLVHALGMFTLWCHKFTGQLPVKLVAWFKNGLGMKSSTSAVKNAYLQVMNVAFSGDRLMQAMDLIPILTQTVERAVNQQTQVSVVSEGVAASCLLTKLSAADIQAESKLGSFWPVVLDMEKQLFVNSRFLSAASDETLQNVVTLVERLVLDHPQRLSETSGPLYRAVVYALTRSAYPVRKHAQSSVRKLLSSLGGGKTAILFLKQFRQTMAIQTVPDLYKDRETSEPSPDAITPRILHASLMTMTFMPAPETYEAEMLALEVLFDAHHPCIIYHNNSTWTDIVALLKLNAHDFIVAHMDDIMSDIKNREQVDESIENTLSTLVRVAPEAVLPVLVDHAVTVLKNPNLMTVTRLDYDIMQIPEGELHDKSIMESGAQTEERQANVRRENKLYSYADQMAEIEIKKELEKKKGKKEAPKLSKKQQEAIQAQLAVESEIRKKTKKMDREVDCVCRLLGACVRGSPSAVRRHLPALLRSITPLFISPLTAPRVTKVYEQLRLAAFDGDVCSEYFACLVCHSTLRLLKPYCALDAAWSEEALHPQVLRTMTELHDLTVTDKNTQLPAATFFYCFYLLRCILQNGGVKVGGEVEVMVQALSVIDVHTKLRSDDTLDLDESGPELLPRKEMLDLLNHVIGTNAGRCQQMAAQGLLDTSIAASGLSGCAAAGQDEIDVLLVGLQSPACAVREAALQGLLAMMMVLPLPDSDYENGMRLMRRVWVAQHEIEEENTKMADRLWTETGLELDPDLCMLLVDDVIHNEEVIRVAAAKAMADALSDHLDYLPAILIQLLEVYQEKLYRPPPVMDKFGRVVSESPPDEFPARCGVAMALCKMSPHLPEDQIPVLFEFFVQKALGDRSAEVRKHMLTAAVAAVDDHGKQNVSQLLPVFEEFLKKAPNTASFDAVRQSVVILMGTLAKHLDKEDPKVKPIVAKLIETLSTPSQQVQEAVANCLPPLVPAIKPDAPELVNKLLQLLLDSEHYGERRGAAYGLAGLVKGLGILALKQLDIMTTLQNAIQNKKNPRHREGALFAFEMLCVMLGRLFEPYVVHILPHLLLCFGDNNHYVREAADDTAKAVMSKLSAHGVKLVLPSLLGALEEESWRTKTGSVELLGAMAYCAPKQLSACLPSIVPKLTEVLTDSHLKVQTAGIQALNQIGSVIRNPEIQAIVPNLLGALQDPTRKTTPCLQTLLDTKFVHFIDAPSLALMMPVVQRAFMDRSTETRKMAAQIIGNMYSLTDQKDLAPYLPTVIPGLKMSLLDPVPEVRTVSARALGAIVKGMGESGFEDLLPWLMQTLTSEASPVDRSGAAQGLSEVVGGLGIEKLHKLMPDIVQTSERTDIAPHVRDGYIMMYIYLPGVFGDEFLTYVGPIIPSILKALADENEYVRDTALRAGQRIVQMYADTAIELLLPQLEGGLFDDNWRIRYSSVQLLGDLLYRISGVSGKMSTETADEDDNFGTENSQQAIMRTLGTERRNRVLSGLYMGRSDTALMVRQVSLHVWKVIVAHTPKTLREILSTLFSLLLGCLASPSYEKRQVAARTLGDVVRKLGEKVLPEIIPILEKGLDSDRSDQRQGVCIGLSEIMSSTSRDHVIVFADSLIPTVRRALCDPLPEVREAAAQTFDNLHSNIGSRALDDILPSLLETLDDEEQSEYALDGLKQVMAVKSRVVLPYLVPQLTAAPVNTRALSFLSSVAGDALTKHLTKILPALMSSLSSKMGTPDEQEELEYCQSVVLSVTDELGVRTVMDELLAATNSTDASVRLSAVTILQAYCQLTKADYTDYIPNLFRGLLYLFTDTDERVLHASWECLNAVTKKMDSSEMLGHISNLRQALRFAVSDFKGEELPGFCLAKKGIAPIWPIFRKGLLDGTPDLKESAAIGLGEVIRRTSAEALKPSVINITGPLIRILSERFSFNVKVAVLETLGLLLGKCGAMLKAFLPQLQTTFIKALNDPNRAVRLKAAAALGKLVVIHTRVEPVFTELHTGIKTTEDVSIRDTMLQALRVCIGGAGSKMSDISRKQMTTTLEGLLSTQEDTTRIMAAACLGALCQCLPEDELASVLSGQLLDTDATLDWTIRHGRVVALSIALKEATEKLLTPAFKPKVLTAILKYCSADRVPLCCSGYRAAGFWLRYEIVGGVEPSNELIAALAKTMKHESNDVKSLAAQIINYIGKASSEPLAMPVIKVLIPMLVNGTRERNTVVRSHSETAIVNLLKLRKGDMVLQRTLSAIEPGMRDSLSEITSKVLRRVATMPDTFDDDIDDTILV